MIYNMVAKWYVEHVYQLTLGRCERRHWTSYFSDQLKPRIAGNHFMSFRTWALRALDISWSVVSTLLKFSAGRARSQAILAVHVHHYAFEATLSCYYFCKVAWSAEASCRRTAEIAWECVHFSEKLHTVSPVSTCLVMLISNAIFAPKKWSPSMSGLSWLLKNDAQCLQLHGLIISWVRTRFQILAYCDGNLMHVFTFNFNRHRS